MNDRVKVLETEQFLAMEMADTLLAEARVPHFIIEHTKSGTSFEMPCAPAFGRGNYWQIVVPRENVWEAEAILSALPFDRMLETSPAAPIKSPATTVRWRIYSLILIVTILLLTVVLSFLIR